jgi:hypothetical protein
MRSTTLCDEHGQGSAGYGLNLICKPSSLLGEEYVSIPPAGKSAIHRICKEPSPPNDTAQEETHSRNMRLTSADEHGSIE